jgi:hypothetical protein
MSTSSESPKPHAATFAEEGAWLMRAALDPSDLRGLEDAIANLPPDQAGIRLYGIAALRPYLSSPGAIWKVAASVLGEATRPVRAVRQDAFDELGPALASGPDNRGNPACGGRGLRAVDRQERSVARSAAL